ncbi:MAG: hypothetical protein V1837_06500, partial [Candidatus Woesearchaeota archaeon]
MKIPQMPAEVFEIDQKLQTVDKKIENIKVRGNKPRHLGMFLLLIFAVLGTLVVVKYGAQNVGLTTYGGTLQYGLNISTASNMTIEIQLAGEPDSISVTG